MKNFIVKLNLHNSDNNNILETFHKRITEYGTWLRIDETTWIIRTTKSAVKVRDQLRHWLTETDNIYVLGLTGDRASFCPTPFKNWMSRYL